MTSIGVDPTTSLEELAQTLTGNLNLDARKNRPTAMQPVADKQMGKAPEDVGTFDWLKVRDEACELIGH